MTEREETKTRYFPPKWRTACTCGLAFFDFPEPGSENNKGPLPKLFSNEGPIQVLHHTFELFPFENSFGGVLVAVGTNTACMYLISD